MSRVAAPEEGNLHLAVESELPAELVVGHGNILTIYGWCFAPLHPTKSLEILVDGEPQAPIAFGMPRADVMRRLAKSTGAPAHAFRSGFWGLVELGEVGEPREVEIGLRARLSGGGVATGRAGVVRLIPGERRSWASLNGGVPRVAICMATFNPPPELFRSQIESIRAQTHEDWICLISDDDSSPGSYAMIEELVGDDPRFRIQRGPRLGYYRNFERALTSVPEDTELVALSDQDDNWHEDKLATLVAEMADGVTLAYSDLLVTDGEGKTISETFWTERANNPNDLGSLLIVNTVTGGSAMFRSDLLEYVLPFPTPPEGGLHDHWVAMVAACFGQFAYVDRPLYDYVQHGAAALGHESLRRTEILRGPGYWRSIRSPAAFRVAVARRLARMRTNYRVVLGARTSAELLLLRGGKAIPWRKRRTLRRWAKVESSPQRWPWLWIRARVNQAKTLGSERRLVAGSLWRWTLSAVKRLRMPAPPAERETLASMMQLPLASEPLDASRLGRLIEPLRLDVSAETPRRVNLVIPTIDLERFFGRSIATFNLARKLAEAGQRVRVIAVDEPFYLPPNWLAEIEGFAGLAGISELIEFELAFDRSSAVAVSPDDRFVATGWWPAQIAHRATEELGGGRFVYLISDCEPLSLGMGSEAALASQTYEFPHHALFTSELLRDYFEHHRLGVFGPAADGEAIAFKSAITAAGTPSPQELADSERKLLFHVRPEQLAARGMYELGLLALSQLRDEGALDGWVLNGIGPLQATEIRYGGGLRINVFERQSPERYAALLRGHAAGLSLLLSPSPSLVSLEMAAAGMPVVTNSFENKSAEALAGISGNLIAAEPTIEGIKSGVRAALEASADHEPRLSGAALRWSESWDESLDPARVEQLNRLLEQK